MNAKNPVLFALILAATGCAASMPSVAAPVAPSAAADAPGVASESSVGPVAASAKSASFPALPTAPAPAARAATPASAKTAPPTTTTAAATAQHDDPDILVVYVGDVSMTVEAGKVSTTADHVIDVAESVGGHLAGRRDGSVTVRVPSGRFHESLEKITALGEVTHQLVSAEDVSEEYHDAAVRLQNLKATQKRLQEFLSRSANVNDMLRLEHELERVSMEIDRTEGRMRFLRDHAAFSTLTVAIAARPKPQPVLAVGGKTPPPPPRILPLHAEWLDQLGVPTLVSN